MKTRRLTLAKAFTLTELMVVVVIIIVLALVAFYGTNRMIDRGKKVQVLAQFRDLNSGMTMFLTDYQKPPIPESKQGDGWDTVYGDYPNPKYHNGFLVAVLLGDSSKDFPSSDASENFKVGEVNRNMTSYIQFPSKPDSKGGVGPDGNLYDPWGTEIIVAVNGGKGRNQDSMVDFNNGSNDRRLYTWGLGEYNETKPRDEEFVFWTYGIDKVKGTKKGTGYKGSDDVISWAP